MSGYLFWEVRVIVNANVSPNLNCVRSALPRECHEYRNLEVAPLLHKTWITAAVRTIELDKVGRRRTPPLCTNCAGRTTGRRLGGLNQSNAQLIVLHLAESGIQSNLDISKCQN